MKLINLDTIPGACPHHTQSLPLVALFAVGGRCYVLRGAAAEFHPDKTLLRTSTKTVKSTSPQRNRVGHTVRQWNCARCLELVIKIAYDSLLIFAFHKLPDFPCSSPCLIFGPRYLMRIKINHMIQLWSCVCLLVTKPRYQWKWPGLISKCPAFIKSHGLKQKNKSRIFKERYPNFVLRKPFFILKLLRRAVQII